MAKAASASLLIASCEELERFLDRPGSPVDRLDEARRHWLGDPEAIGASWLCSPAERDWHIQVLASAPRTPPTRVALDACARAIQPRLLLIDEPERHLSASIAKDAAAWLHQRAQRPDTQIVIATHSPAFLACRGDDVRHVHVQRASDGLLYTSFSPADDEALQRVASEMGLNHGDLFGLVTAIVWVEGPMDRAVLDALCGEELKQRGIHVATYGGLGNMRSVLDNPSPASITDNLYFGKYLSATGETEYPKLLREAIKSGTDDSLATALTAPELFKSHYEKKKPSGGFTSTKAPHTANRTLTEGEVNRFYLRGICLRALAEGTDIIEIYRARASSNPRAESEAMIGTRLDAGPPRHFREPRIRVRLRATAAVTRNDGWLIRQFLCRLFWVPQQAQLGTQPCRSRTANSRKGAARPFDRGFPSSLWPALLAVPSDTHSAS